MFAMNFIWKRGDMSVIRAVTERGPKAVLPCALCSQVALFATLGGEAEVVKPQQFADIASIRNTNELINTTHASIRPGINTTHASIRPGINTMYASIISAGAAL